MNESTVNIPTSFFDLIFGKTVKQVLYGYGWKYYKDVLPFCKVHGIKPVDKASIIRNLLLLWGECPENVGEEVTRERQKV